MTTARSIISDALTFGVNRLSPGESLDADLAAMCLSALNSVVDEVNGGKAMLYREIVTNGTMTAATGTLGTTWSGLAPGDMILGATVTEGGVDVPLSLITMRQYHEIPTKTTAGTPDRIAHDGLSTVYAYPVPTSSVVKLRTRAEVADFADLDTDYTLPSGYRSALAALLAERIAPSLGALSPVVLSQARAARIRLLGQVVQPDILEAGAGGRARIEQGY